MIEAIFVVLGLVMFTDALMDKWKIWDRLAKWAMKFPVKFFFLLLMCRFCMMFHLSWIITLVYGAANGFSWRLLIAPAIVSGLIHLKGK